MNALAVKHNLTNKSLSGKLLSISAVVQQWIERHHQRKQLAQLDIHLLNDIGVSKSQVVGEIDKPFWQ
jgi:uncharacterized protein YjiS (DUF1127 family)